MCDGEIKYKNEDGDGETSTHGNSTSVRCFELSACAGTSLKQVVLDQRTWVGVCGGCVDGRGRRVADDGCGRDDGGRDGDAVIVSGHVLRTVSGDYWCGGSGHDRCGSGQGNGCQTRRGSGGHGGQTTGDDSEQRHFDAHFDFEFIVEDTLSMIIV